MHSPQPERKVFVSYRRIDNPDFVERIRDWFMQRYGRPNVFMDFDNIPPFTPFADYIRERVRECDVLIAIIGPRWLELLREKTFDPADDYVRVEIRLALEENKLIAPICIKGAAVPHGDDLPDDLRALIGYNAAHLDSGRTFLDNIELIMDAVEQELARRERVQVDIGNVEAMTTAPFELHDAILNFHSAADSNEWKAALMWLERIRQSKQAPRFFRLDEYENEIRAEIENEAAERDYKVIRIM
ncbi:MAG: toll/interleukin-1 receptor domain-containing protein, partial [Burkholderiales bacterium]|nr:toll/interleukin-1 receptor domain-containing protein [Anaerolineae bacterium]